MKTGRQTFQKRCEKIIRRTVAVKRCCRTVINIRAVAATPFHHTTLSLIITEFYSIPAFSDPITPNRQSPFTLFPFQYSSTTFSMFISYFFFLKSVFWLSPSCVKTFKLNLVRPSSFFSLISHGRAHCETAFSKIIARGKSNPREHAIRPRVVVSLGVLSRRMRDRFPKEQTHGLITADLFALPLMRRRRGDFQRREAANPAL